MYRLFLDGGAIPRSVSQAERERAAQNLTARAARGKPETALFAGRYENSVIVAAAAPIFSADGKQVFGVIQLAQTADRWLTLRDRALTRLLNLTLFVTLFAVGRGLLVRGPHDPAHLAARRRQRNRAGTRGQPVARVARGRGQGRARRLVAQLFVAARPARRIHRLPAHAGRQAGPRDPHAAHHHPFVAREPGVRSAGSNGIRTNAKVYIARAREGSERLGAILTAMGAATRVEEAIAHSERQRFDLAALVRAAVGAYGGAFPQRRFVCAGRRTKPSRSPALPSSSCRCSTS